MRALVKAVKTKQKRSRKEFTTDQSRTSKTGNPKDPDDRIGAPELTAIEWTVRRIKFDYQVDQG
jgi:hypothetical protein